MVDVSKNVVAILLILVVLISGLGTYTLLSREAAPLTTPVSQSATVALAIESQPRDAGNIGLAIEGNTHG